MSLLMQKILSNQLLLNHKISNILLFLIPFLFSFIFSLYALKKLINFLQKTHIFQPIRTDGPKTHLKKRNTPTMAGIVIITSILLSSLLFTDIFSAKICTILIVLIGYAILGFMDDYYKLKYKNSGGLSAKQKMMFQILIAAIASIILEFFKPESSRFILNFFSICSFQLPFLIYLFFSTFVIVGTSNAVNLTDGLDGLVTLQIITTMCALAVLIILGSDSSIQSHQSLNFAQKDYDILIFITATVGSMLAFLWYNTNPAQIFMGDIGALSLGGVIGVIGIILKIEFSLAIICFIFVIEALSVIIQITYFKITSGKRIFLMSPIHHHFEKKGIPETQIVIRFWIVSIICAIFGVIISII